MPEVEFVDVEFGEFGEFAAAVEVELAEAEFEEVEFVDKSAEAGDAAPTEFVGLIEFAGFIEFVEADPDIFAVPEAGAGAIVRFGEAGELAALGHWAARAGPVFTLL